MPLMVVAALLMQTAAPHSKEFWHALAKDKYELPAGTAAASLIPELLDDLASPDPELRDDIAYSALTAWIYQKKLLGPAELRPMIATLRGNLRKGIGETGGDGILLRSFSALTLSVIAARDNDTPFLSPAEHRELVDAALAYFRDERDLRGFDSTKGWMHSAAHTSDLLKFLARGSHLAVADQARILSALAAKNRDAAASFSQGEDERMARVVVSIVRRADFDRAAYKAWLGAMQAAAKFPETPSVASLRAMQNVRHVLAALWTELSVDERPSEGADFARQALREALRTLF